jgi:predicted lipoprotein with Yx(FWY)xxD motif
MRSARIATVCAALLVSGPALAEDAPSNKQHPGNVALAEEGEGWVYKQFPTMLRLYVFDDDRDGKFACVDDCLLRWPPLYAPSGAKKVGNWTTMKRADGQLQWAYKGRPAYMRYHDSAKEPNGHLVDAKWRFLEP